MRFKSLDGWRGLAALFVALYHLPFINHIYDLPFLRNSFLFVDFFFVLSGFVITHAYQNRLYKTQDITLFIKKRIARLWPLHIFVLLLFLGFEFLKLFLYKTGSLTLEAVPFTGEYSVESFVSNLLLMQSLGFHSNLSWNYPSWSISAEFYTYIVFALIFLISNKSKMMIQLQYFILILVSFYILYRNVDLINYATYDFGLFRCIPGFLLGSISYILHIKSNNFKMPLASLIEIAVITATYFFFVYAGDTKFSLIAPFMFSLVVFVFSFEQGILSKFLQNHRIQNLGKWSYSIYMLHALLILIIGRTIKVIARITENNWQVDHYSYSTGITQKLTLIGDTYLMDILTIMYLLLLVYLSSKSFKYIEMKGSRLFTRPQKVVIQH